MGTSDPGKWNCGPRCRPPHLPYLGEYVFSWILLWFIVSHCCCSYSASIIVFSILFLLLFLIFFIGLYIYIYIFLLLLLLWLFLSNWIFTDFHLCCLWQRNGFLLSVNRRQGRQTIETNYFEYISNIFHDI